uniref:uncharacterized protein LOC100176290 isoform X2 n=1 Tax=Ciona intestinalis TaxID=7719 RepID=UPI000521A70A|nr:uncharacterized protein LOC100176290 isoform X2 [Ciona intestinalis]|eukprot:XP_009862069.1 uncharacterized protein LOC100176290 isoform X2 [Ciona intestinalis]
MDSSVSTSQHSHPSQNGCGIANIVGIPIINELELGKATLIGGGGFGQVYKRQWNLNGEPVYVAEKVLLGRGIPDVNDQGNLRKEAENLWKLRHPNIVELHGVIFSEQKFSIIMSYCEFGSTVHFFNSLRNNEDTWPLKMRISYQVSDAMAYLHGFPKPMLHLDLKADNVLLNAQLDVKVCDFGLSEMKTLSRITQELLPKESKSSHRCGTISHIAPEILQNPDSPASTYADVYSYGIFLWELMAQTQPYEAALRNFKDSDIIRDIVLKGDRPDPDITGPPSLLETMVQAWKHEKNDRPDFSDIKEKLAMKQYDAQEVSNCVRKLLVLCTKLSESIRSSVGQSNVHRYPHNALGTYYSDDVQPNIYPNVTPRAFTSNRDEETNPKQVLLPHIHSNTIETDSTHRSDGDIINAADARPLLTNSTDGTDHFLKITSPSWSRRKKFTVSFLVIIVLLLLAGLAAFLVFKFRSADCQSPAWDQSGSHICTKNPVEGKYPSGTTCTLTCKAGYGVRAGSLVSLCETNGSWNASFGSCVKLGVCSLLPDPANGGTTTCTNHNFEMSICSYSCPLGFQLAGDKSSSSTCKVIGGDISDAVWSSPVPYCEKVTVCPSVPPSSTGDVTCSTNEDPPSNGTICKVQCHENYAVKGNIGVLCGKDGKWNSTIPYCQRVCPLLEFEEAGTYTCTHSRFITSVCTFNCGPNFILLGSLRSTCMPRGSWTNPVPRCVCPQCRGGTKCDSIRTWNDILSQMKEALQTHSHFHYDINELLCTSQVSNSTSCICRDVKTNRSKQCNNYQDEVTACTHSLASLILMMSYDGGWVVPM